MAEEKRLENRKDRIIGKIKEWFKDPSHKILFGILALALAIRLYYFFMVGQQPLWFDESEYMAQAKRLAFGYNDWFWTWSPRKPILMSFFFSLLYRIGLTEGFFRVLLLLTSLIGVYFTYVVSKDFFNKKVGLIAAFLMSVWWVHHFFTLRFLTWMPASTLLLVATHFFYKGYIKKQGAKYIWLFGVFFSLAFLMRVTAGIFIVPFLIYFVLEEKWRFVLNKHLWIALILAILVTVPFFVWLSFHYPDDPIGLFLGIKYGRFEIGASAGEDMGVMGLKGFVAYANDFPNLLKLPFLLLFIFGLFFLMADLLLGFDLIFKKDYQHLRFYALAIIWILLSLLAYGYTRSYVEQRDAMSFSVFMFSIIGVGAVKLYDSIKKHNKSIAIIAVLGLLVLGSYPQLVYGNELIMMKKDSYGPIKQAGLWLKENGNQGDWVSTKSVPQINYYSELNGYGVPGPTEEDFMKTMSEKNVRFFAPSTFEPYWLTPEWSYTWGQRHPEIATPMWFWADNPQQPSNWVIIYELDWSNYTPSLNVSNSAI